MLLIPIILLLGVIPVNTENHNSILRQRCEHYEELENSLNIMFKIKENTTKPIVHTLMFLLTEDVLEFDIQKQVNEFGISMYKCSTVKLLYG